MLFPRAVLLVVLMCVAAACSSDPKPVEASATLGQSAAATNPTPTREVADAEAQAVDTAGETVPQPDIEPENEPLKGIRLPPVATLDAAAVASRMGLALDALPQWIMMNDDEVITFVDVVAGPGDAGIVQAINRAKDGPSVVAAAWIAGCRSDDLFIDVQPTSVVFVANASVAVCDEPQPLLSVFVVPLDYWPDSSLQVHIGRQTIDGDGPNTLSFTRPSTASPALFRVNLSQTPAASIGADRYVSTDAELAQLRSDLADVVDDNGGQVTERLRTVDLSVSALLVAEVDTGCPEAFWLEPGELPAIISSAAGTSCDVEDVWLVGFEIPTAQLNLDQPAVARLEIFPPR